MAARAAQRLGWQVAPLRAVVAACMVTLLSACSLGRGTIPLAAAPGDLGTKMLRPGATARACGAAVWPFGGRGQSPLLERATRALLASDEEADVILDLDVQWRGVDLLLVTMGCVRVRGDVARRTSTVRLPMLGDHGAHVGH